MIEARIAIVVLFICRPVLAEPVVATAPAALIRDIPAQSLAGALESFAYQTGLQYIFVSGVVNDQRTQGAPAGLAPDEALSRLLAGSGLRFEFLNARIIRILADTPRPAVSQPPPALDEVLVVAHRIPKPHIAPPTAKEQQTLDAANADIEAQISREHLLYSHPTLDRYVQGVGERLLAVDGTDASAMHVRVIKSLDANAFALSNGSIYLTTALLASLQDESQLAAVLGHEVTHYTNSDALRDLRNTNHQELAAFTKGTLFNVVLALITPSGGDGFYAYNSLAISPETMQIWARAAISGYSSGLEREADEGGVRRMISSGYDPIGALAALQHLTEQLPASPGAQTSFYASLPRLEDRLASYRDLLAGELAPAAGIGERRHQEYRTQLGELPLDQVSILINAGALDSAERLLAAEMAVADSGRGEFLRGEISSKRVPRTEATTNSALIAYERAVGLPGAPVSVYRKAGILHRLKGEPAIAAHFFRDYLDHAPTALDAPLVRLYLDELQASTLVPEVSQ
jgi:hypothetical protein